MTGLNNSDIIAELTPYQWTPEDRTRYRSATMCNIVGNTQRMREHLESLPREAQLDLLHQVPVLLDTLKHIVGVEPMSPYWPSIRHESIKVPCGRCGHEEKQHDEPEFGRQERWCWGCADNRCQPVKVPVGVEGWKTGGRPT